MSTDTIAQLFAGLPGTIAFKIVAPATQRTQELDVAMEAGTQLFIGSSFKGFVTAEAFRQDDSPDVVTAITERQLDLDATVWSPDSATYNPPDLTGRVSERTALEAMILHSDNTGADMILKQVGPDNMRAFLASAGLTKSLNPYQHPRLHRLPARRAGLPDVHLGPIPRRDQRPLRQPRAEHDRVAGVVG